MDQEETQKTRITVRHLSEQSVKYLTSLGFWYVEDVLALPEEAILRLRNIGRKTLAELRRAKEIVDHDRLTARVGELEDEVSRLEAEIHDKDLKITALQQQIEQQRPEISG